MEFKVCNKENFIFFFHVTNYLATIVTSFNEA